MKKRDIKHSSGNRQFGETRIPDKSTWNNYLQLQIDAFKRQAITSALIKKQRVRLSNY